ncbi:MAG: SCO1664 family protein [Chloroflexi bacterium]|nr:SCO1664 family protein [Chloroflexota bacterium]
MSQDPIRKTRANARRPRISGAKNEINVAESVALLKSGAMNVQELVPWSSNYTFLVTISGAGRQVPAIYKPSRGERPLWDFPSGTLAKREYAAYLLSAALGWPNVPPTVLRDGPQGIGAVQLFIEAVEGEHYFTLRDAYREEMKRIAIFDAVINNTDRKGGHVLLGKNGTIWCIDHGVTFHEHPKLRTVIWDFTQEPIPAPILDDLRSLQAKLVRPDPFAQSLAPLLSVRETDALCGRIQELVVSGVFPEPPEDWPHIPWPPI